MDTGVIHAVLTVEKVVLASYVIGLQDFASVIVTRSITAMHVTKFVVKHVMRRRLIIGLVILSLASASLVAKQDIMVQNAQKFAIRTAMVHRVSGKTADVHMAVLVILLDQLVHKHLLMTRL